ncbi:MAG: alkaline phosphatase family protein [Candidatus Tumulicola sp.]
MTGKRARRAFRTGSFVCVTAALVAGAALAQTGLAPIVLPNGWTIARPIASAVQTGTMPQGMAASPDGTSIAVVEGGYNPPALTLYRVPDLTRIVSISLPGAFGRPVWLDGNRVLVAGANADALLEVDVASHRVDRIAMPAHSYPILVAAAANGSTIAVATDGDGAVRIGTLANVGAAHRIAIGGQPGGLAFGAGDTSLFATSRATSQLVRIVVATGATTRRKTGLHPGALAVASGNVYVAQSDADSVGIYDASDLHAVASVGVGSGPAGAIGSSPNDVSVGPAGILVSLGAANSVAVIRDDRLAGRMPAGWYPTAALAIGGTLYVLDGKGEGSRPNPLYRGGDRDYIGAIEFGSLRSYPLPADAAAMPGGNPPGATGWHAAASHPVVRAHGPITHVFFVLRENRTYDQVLGDAPGGNGAASLARFGRNVTPNAHALVRRFGLFDNAYTSGEVSVPGHMWSDAAFADDYVERFWPPLYAGRYTIDDITSGRSPSVPAGGYLWDSARRAHVTFRDYGELANPDKSHPGRWMAAVPSLTGRIDSFYGGWNLDVSDLERAKEWRRDLAARLAAGNLPQLEFIWLPGDHTYGARPGKLTPESYVAINDEALGQMIDALSHSQIWKSSAMFVIEDDSQDGPDHVSDQRTAMLVVSPYARGGVRHEHYSTLSILRTIETVLGMQPLSLYDATAVPMDAAFRATPDLRPYAALPPNIDVTRRNGKVAYGAALSARIDFSRPDAAPPGVMARILERDSASRR